MPRCSDCRARIGKRWFTRCRPCHFKALSSRRGTINGIVLAFSARQFDAYLRRTDVEWTTGLLAVAAGVGTTTINAWRSGGQKPRADELARVAAVLAIEACADCNGQGIRYPDRAAVAAVERTLTSAPVWRQAPLASASFGHLSLEPNARSLTLGSRQLTLSRQEYRLLARLIQADGRYVTVQELAEAIWQPEQSPEPSQHSVRTHLNRLRTKCEAVGLGWPVVTGHGLGYRIEVPA